MTREEFIAKTRKLIEHTPAEDMPREFWDQVDEVERVLKRWAENHAERDVNDE